MTLQKKDFIEIEFTGRIKDTNEVFDSNIKKDLEKTGIKHSAEPKPFVFSLGEGMFLQGIDEFIIGKEVGKHNIELSPEKAFGLRDPKLIRLIPLRLFKQQNINPLPGVMFNFDGKIAKIISVSGGRIIADFNNPIAGKTVIYEINILRKVEDVNEKAKSFINFLFMRDLDFKIQDKKITIELEKFLIEFAGNFKNKFKEVLGLDLEVKEKEIKEKEQKTNNTSKQTPQ